MPAIVFVIDYPIHWREAHAGHQCPRSAVAERSGHKFSPSGPDVPRDSASLVFSGCMGPGCHMVDALFCAPGNGASFGSRGSDVRPLSLGLVRPCVTEAPWLAPEYSNITEGRWFSRACSATSFPSASPKLPGSTKSRCISMMMSASFAGSRRNGCGSAGISKPFMILSQGLTNAAARRLGT
ncbi:MAG: hypothetical protein HW416_2559 [Chloroflexi bacterium]|nr:hypothetical protein [Chloroflexota bacterium]